MEGDQEVVRTVKRGRRGRWWKRGLWGLALAATTLLVAWWAVGDTSSDDPRFLTSKVRRGDLEVTVIATGTLKALTSVDVGAEITGRVLEVNVQFNDRVKKGQVLARIDTSQYDARVEEASAQLASAGASLATAKATREEARLQYERTKTLHAQKLTSERDLETARATFDRAKASVSSSLAQATLARAGLKVAKTNLEKAVIISPIDGVVLNRTVEPGQTVTSGLQTPVLFTLASDLNKLRLQVEVDEADVGRVKRGQRARFTVDAYPGKVFSSEVLAVKNQPTPEQTVVTYESWLAVDNQDGLLRPGMTATATVIVDDQKDAMLVPNAALRFSPPKEASAGGGGFSLSRMLRGRGRRRTPGRAKTDADEEKPKVYQLVKAKGRERPRRVIVATGPSDGRNTVVKSEKLKAGDEVIVNLLATSR